MADPRLIPATLALVLAASGASAHDCPGDVAAAQRAVSRAPVIKTETGYDGAFTFRSHSAKGKKVLGTRPLLVKASILKNNKGSRLTQLEYRLPGGASQYRDAFTRSFKSGKVSCLGAASCDWNVSSQPWKAPPGSLNHAEIAESMTDPGVAFFRCSYMGG